MRKNPFSKGFSSINTCRSAEAPKREVPVFLCGEEECIGGGRVFAAACEGEAVVFDIPHRDEEVRVAAASEDIAAEAAAPGGNARYRVDYE